MEQNFILTSGEGEQKKEYLIGDVYLIDGKCYFSVLDLGTFDVMFGEFLGETEEDSEINRERIYQDFLNQCPNITFVDGYMLDELYDMLDGM